MNNHNNILVKCTVNTILLLFAMTVLFDHCVNQSGLEH